MNKVLTNNSDSSPGKTVAELADGDKESEAAATNHPSLRTSCELSFLNFVLSRDADSSASNRQRQQKLSGCSTEQVEGAWLMAKEVRQHVIRILADGALDRFELTWPAAATCPLKVTIDGSTDPAWAASQLRRLADSVEHKKGLTE